MAETCNGKYEVVEVIYNDKQAVVESDKQVVESDKLVVESDKQVVEEIYTCKQAVGVVEIYNDIEVVVEKSNDS